MNVAISWPLASMILICLALAGVTVWYERSRPSSRLVAMIAALAALAIAGRVVAPVIPNVQATSDVTMLSGYVLGPGPGFAIGAIGALGSNVFLGQGPWTPWEMFGWGMVGVSGALLARAAGRRFGRLPLALACGLAGFVFGAWMDLSVMMNFSGQQSSDSYLVIAAGSLPFNLAHAVGNFLFALALGPGFVRLLERFRVRLAVRWTEAAHARPHVPTVGISALAVMLMVAIAPAAALGDSDRAVDYLERAQNTDGGFAGALGQSSSQLMTGWVVLGLETGGRNPLDWSRGGKTPIDYMRGNLDQVSDAAELSRTILALRGAGVRVRNVSGRNLLSELERLQRSDGSFQRQAPTTAFAVMALRGAGRSNQAKSVRRATGWLAAQQNPDGGYSNGAKGGAGDVDDTGAALQGLAAVGLRRGLRVKRAVAFLEAAQNNDGGMGQFPDARSNSQSSAWAAQGLVAVGRERAALRPKAGRSLLGYLWSLQQSNGSFRYSRTSVQTPVWVTAQVLAAVRRKPFPLDPLPRKSSVRTARSRTSSTEVARAATRRSNHRSRRHTGARVNTGAGLGAAGLGVLAASLQPSATPADGARPAATAKGQTSGRNWPALGALAAAAIAACGAGLWLLRRRRVV